MVSEWLWEEKRQQQRAELVLTAATLGQPDIFPRDLCKAPLKSLKAMDAKPHKHTLPFTPAHHRYISSRTFVP